MQLSTSNLKISTADLNSEAMPVCIAVGQDAKRLLADTDFQLQWDRLYEECKWATAFQSRDFVSIWYSLNEYEYTPVIVTGEQNGKLNGLLTMAILKDSKSKSTLRNKRSRLVSAGNYEAEYQTWLTSISFEHNFINEALSILIKTFPKHDIYFRFIPAGTSVKNLAYSPNWEKFCVLQTISRPLMEMNKPETAKLFRKRGFNLKLNRLKRLGDIKFTHISDPDQFKIIYQQLKDQYDFRQGAMFNKIHFKGNSQASELLLKLFDCNLLHVTVLTLNNEPIASIVGVQDKNWVHLGGINTHSPFYAAHSPGFVHFILLGQLLTNENSVTIFDLTPGGDAYKERMATSHDYVYELLISSSYFYNLKRRIRKFLHDQLIKSGYRPISMELILTKKAYLLNARLKGLHHRLWFSNSGYGRSEIQYQSDYTTELLNLSTNSLKDLLCFEQIGTQTTKWEFLEEAMTRFENGEDAYTYTENKQLLFCTWIKEKDKEKSNKQSIYIQVPLLEVTYCHPAVTGMLPSLLTNAYALVNAPALKLPNQAIIRINDNRLLKALRESGFRIRKIGNADGSVPSSHSLANTH
ncbi:GNAT family N-acetyltransferase [Pontibacter indicus]|uniref:Acetyltransferase (GNAT) domain-containing protein n=1 Tax=Pontibacter indicus TaxID=1317125 RepID=A0A1R3WC01_9BACT|nr:GNAT family N-acetyltransferase [Pontibacter indicus]SIT75423.1 Acetyltransferase (GNAT) domain-containing protein [Pontibacter indicus]